MAYNNGYKLYQLMQYFIEKYNYLTTLSKTNYKDNEVWLVNTSFSIYNIIRISIDQNVGFINDERVNNYIQEISNTFGISNPSYLEFYINDEEVIKELYPNTVSINVNHYSGIDIKNIFPNIEDVIHEVSNEKIEIARITLSIKNTIAKQKRDLNKQNKSYVNNLFSFKETPITFSIIFICIFMYILHYFMSLKYDDIASLIVLGADYKTFTLGLHEYWRLLTCVFSHGSIFHLLFNMMSLYNLGRPFEAKYGKLKFLFVLFSSVLFGSLTSGIMQGNNVIVGISGGLYGLFAYYIIFTLNNGYKPNREFFNNILVNVYINFLSGVAWQAHLGGFVCGFICYYIFEESDKTKKIIMSVLMFLSLTVLGVRYSNSNLNPYYAGTDMEVLEITNDLGLTDYSNNKALELYKLYIQEGDK